MKTVIQIKFDMLKSRELSALVYVDVSDRYYFYYGGAYFYGGFEPTTPFYPVDKNTKLVIVDKFI